LSLPRKLQSRKPPKSRKAIFSRFSFFSELLHLKNIHENHPSFLFKSLLFRFPFHPRPRYFQSFLPLLGHSRIDLAVAHQKAFSFFLVPTSSNSNFVSPDLPCFFLSSSILKHSERKQSKSRKEFLSNALVSKLVVFNSPFFFFSLEPFARSP